jgi:predicted component of type VI protein secretion system
MKIQFFKLILILSSSMVMSQTSLAGDGGLRFAEKNQEIEAQIQAKKKTAEIQAQSLQARASTETK